MIGKISTEEHRISDKEKNKQKKHMGGKPEVMGSGNKMRKQIGCTKKNSEKYNCENRFQTFQNQKGYGCQVKNSEENEKQLNFVVVVIVISMSITYVWGGAVLQKN